ncbi:MAG: hypothetical protein JO250_13830 [Armatimonadetes bacterium]|nr:hypothetical protein [Armatimonadota bacterium]
MDTQATPATRAEELSATPPPRRRTVTPRAVCLGVLLLPLNAYWVVCMEVIRYSAHPTTLSLFFNCVFELVVLTLLNAGLTRLRPRWALGQGELLLVYAMLGIGSALCGHDSIQVLVPMLAWPVYNASTGNHWATLFAGTYPRWLTLTDHDAARGFFEGNSTLYTPDHLRAWAVPVAAWTLFLLTLLFVLQCVNTILRQQWTDNERLTYPLVRLPLEITAQAPGGPGGTPLTRQKLFWLGFALTAAADVVNALNYYFPSIPPLGTPGNGASFWDLHQFIVNKPWNAVGWTPASFYPFLVGLGMLMPMDFLFSLWFFYLFWKMQSVLVVANAWDADPQMPYANYQSFGAYMLFCVSSLWLARHYLRQVLRCALGRPSELDDRDEPLRYRTALLGIAGGLLLLIGFSVSLGLAWWLAVLFFLIYLGLALAITRMRAELGTPIHDLHMTGPDNLLPALLGPSTLGRHDLGVFSVFYWFNRAYRCQPMPIQLEAFKMADASGGRRELRGWFWALLLAGGVGALCGFWAMLHLTYQFGALAKADRGAMMAFGTETWNRLANWLQQPKPPNGSVMVASLVGFLFAAALQAMRVRFSWWPFHPLAYAVSSSFEINLVWMPLLIAWVVKSALLRYGGMRMYQQSLPFFYGLMLGQFVEGSLLNIWGISTGTPTYQFWQ